MTSTRPATLARITFTLPEIPAPPEGFRVTHLMVDCRRFGLDLPYAALSELIAEGTDRAKLYAIADGPDGTDAAAEYDADSGEWGPWGDPP